MTRLGNVWVQRLLLLACVLLAFLVSNKAKSSEEDDVVAEQHIGVGDPALGKLKIKSENCQECHGEFGVGLSPSAPKLAGQYADYIVKQLRNFKSGERKHPVMNVMADSLTDDDRFDIAAYYASNKIMQGEGAVDIQIARNLFYQGDMARNIPPCKSCHGETGKGKYSVTGCYPVIGGQYMIYLREQLRNWRSGERTNSPGGVMNIVARTLSDTEIEALSNFVSGL